MNQLRNEQQQKLKIKKFQKNESTGECSSKSTNFDLPKMLEIKFQVRWTVLITNHQSYYFLIEVYLLL